jgi:hypothetical protein
MTLTTRSLCIAALLVGTFILPAAAQTPDEGVIAVGLDVGFLFPDEAFETTFAASGYGEFYLTPRLSVRGMLEAAKPALDGSADLLHRRQARLLFNGVYNWEFGEWHPYATAGAGAYFVRLVAEGEGDLPGETRGGLNFGGGVEYFFAERSTIKGEGRFDVVSHPPGFPDASSFVLTIGLKHYF